MLMLDSREVVWEAIEAVTGFSDSSSDDITLELLGIESDEFDEIVNVIHADTNIDISGMYYKPNIKVEKIIKALETANEMAYDDEDYEDDY